MDVRQDNGVKSFEDLLTLLDSWAIHLRAEHKSERTIKTYRDGVLAFLRWSQRVSRPPELDRPTVTAFVADLVENGAESTTVYARHRAVRRFAAWLTEEGEIDEDQIAGLKPPKVDVKVVPEITEDQIKAMVKACAGKTLRDRRDEAIVRFMLETMARAGEVVAMELADVDVQAGMAVVRRGKGGKGRRVAFGPQTGRSIDRYLRVRRTHRLASTSTLWLGDRGKTLGYDGLYRTLKYRAEVAGIPGFHPHMLRHTGAGRWLNAGGSEGGLMATAGWTTREMIDRYTKATSERRAAEEARRLNIGDV